MQVAKNRLTDRLNVVAPVPTKISAPIHKSEYDSAMSLIDTVMKQAAALPLKDAAFEIWRHKLDFDREELPPPPLVDLSDPEVAAQHMREFEARYAFERANAHDGATFARVRRVHPKATDADIKAAIKAAVKFDDDCVKYFDRDTDFFKAIDTALAQAKRDNPGYLDRTYQSAGNFLFYCFK